MTFSCTAVSFLFQPEVYWIVDNETNVSCSSEPPCRRDVLNTQTTRGVLSITTSKETNHMVTCVVEQEPDVRRTALLTVLAAGDT